MNRPPEFSTLHVEALRGDYGDPRSDYPLPLLTRRVLAQASSEILRTREHAPVAVGFSAAARRLSRRPV